MIVVQNPLSTPMPLPSSSSVSPPTKRPLCVDEVLTSDRLPWRRKLLGILASFHTGVLESIPGHLTICFTTISIEPACDWPLDPPSSILCDCARAAEVLHFSSLKVHWNSKFYNFCRFLSWNKHRACERGSK
jgi:hypothetical protein